MLTLANVPADATDFDFMAHLLHCIARHMPRLQRLSLAAINHRTRLPLGPLYRLQHFAVAAHSISFEQPLPQSLPARLTSVHIVCLEADEQTQQWLATRAALPLQHTLMESFYVLAAKRGPPTAMDIDASVLDDLDSHMPGGMHSRDSGEQPEPESTADGISGAWLAEQNETGSGSSSSPRSDDSDSESAPVGPGVNDNRLEAVAGSMQHADSSVLGAWQRAGHEHQAGSTEEFERAPAVAATVLGSEQGSPGSVQSVQLADGTHNAQASAASPVQRTFQATSISSPAVRRNGAEQR